MGSQPEQTETGDQNSDDRKTAEQDSELLFHPVHLIKGIIQEARLEGILSHEFVAGIFYIAYGLENISAPDSNRGRIDVPWIAVYNQLFNIQTKRMIVGILNHSDSPCLFFKIGGDFFIELSQYH